MRLGLVIDLDVCVGCHACAIACKEWNASGTIGPLSDYQPYGAEPSGVWFNRIRHYEMDEYPNNKTVNFPMSCMHCEDADCVTVCPTGASYKRAEDGIVLIDQDKCMGCNYCSWACPYGARELDRSSGTMKKCTLCVDRIYDQQLPVEERQPSCVLTCPAHARMFGDFDDRFGGVARGARARRLPADARAQLQPDQPVPAAAPQAGDSGRHQAPRRPQGKHQAVRQQAGEIGRAHV